MRVPSAISKKSCHAIGSVRLRQFKGTRASETHLLAVQNHGLLAALDHTGQYAERGGYAAVWAWEADSAVGEYMSGDTGLPVDVWRVDGVLNLRLSLVNRSDDNTERNTHRCG